MKKFIFFIFFSLLFCHSFTDKKNLNKKDKIDIVLYLDELRSIKGNLVICIYTYNEREWFPFFPCERAYIKIQVSSGILNKENNKIIIKNIPEGEYAFYLIHDEVSNNDYDYNRKVPERYWKFIPGWFTEIFSPTFPIEGQGYSNYHRPVFFTPKFKNSAIYLDKEHNEITLHISYFWNYAGGITSILISTGWIISLSK